MFLNPSKSVLQLGLHEGMRVADFGAGSGFYVKALSTRVGHTGKIYAIEIQKDLLKKLENELKHEGVSNVICIWGDIEKKGGTKIADESMDMAVLSNVLFQVEDKLGAIDEAKRIVKKGGKIVVIEWSESFGGMGPAPENVVTERQLADLFRKRGFTHLQHISTSPHHYGILFTV